MKIKSVEERDEVQEVRKQSSKETARVRMWRLLVMFVLLATAVAITVTTYKLLINQEDENFRNVYDQFARAVADAAVKQQATLRRAHSVFEDTVAVAAKVQGNGTSPWPYFVPPMFEKYASNVIKIANAEFMAFQNFVTHAQRKDGSYIGFANSVYKKEIASSHMIAYGHTDFLDKNESKYDPFIKKKTPDGEFIPDDDREFYFCRTAQSPPVRSYNQFNVDLLANSLIRRGYMAVLELHTEAIISPIKRFANLPEEEHKLLHSNGGADNPHSFIYYPLHETVGDDTSPVVAMVATASAWDVSMRNLLPDNVQGMFCVLENTCNQTVTYRIDGKDALYLGKGDLHPKEYDSLARFVDLNLQTHPNASATPGHCLYSMKIYPSKAFEDDYKTNTPVVFASVVAGTFLLVAIIYFIYDVSVQRRNEMMIKNAATANAVVTSFVPDHLRDRLLDAKAATRNLKSFLNDGKNGPGKAVGNGKPLADLFLETTVLFADITGFTAWSSVREPTQVFTLLENVYHAFDRIAKRRRIFKVETVGDCYVAVAGLPDPREDHAVAMARFARDILNKMKVLTKKLEVVLGPDTGDLDLRIGIHTGPVTAGVLRGERSRFQLFGDTMNTCARLESTSKRGSVQASKETAEQIIRAGFASWLERRADPVLAKGKGELESYWVKVDSSRPRSVASSISEEASIRPERNISFRRIPGLDSRTYRLIDWNCETLIRVMKQIVSHRSAKSQKFTRNAEANLVLAPTPLEEVQEIIALPEFDMNAAEKLKPEEVVIPAEVASELHRLISVVASMYNDNPFHNFEHASHVVMSVTKLLSRIVVPSHLDGLDSRDSEVAASLHDHTYGITSDPLTQFACAFSALIHDVDHVGVSNAQLVKEAVPIATKYGRSVAEQNSLDLSWELLMSAEFLQLRTFLFPTATELVRFRRLVVNSVMATDIVDKDLKALRNARWDKAFKQGSSANHIDENPRDEVNRKATIIIEHLIQASDVSHTMQHWHVYRKWNQSLFEELYVAFLNGRMEKNPAEFWYNGEIGFFDFYIIPLTQKLKDCGVFGISSDEYLNYAKKNREEWESRGQEVVASMLEEMRKKYGGPGEQCLPEQAPPRSGALTRLDDVLELEEGLGETEHARMEVVLGSVSGALSQDSVDAESDTEDGDQDDDFVCGDENGFASHVSPASCEDWRDEEPAMGRSVAVSKQGEFGML